MSLSILEQSELIRKEQRHWYAIYTRPRFERKVFEDLETKQIKALLPVRAVNKVWSDRVKRVIEPLFPSYVFTYSNCKERYRSLESPGVVRMVAFCGQPIRIPDEQIDAIATLMRLGYNPEPCQYLRAGDRVEVTSGPLTGILGYYLQDRGKTRIVVTVDAIQQAMAVEVERDQIRKIAAKAA